MTILKVTLFALASFNLSAAWAKTDICAAVYGKHKLFHHIKNWIGPAEFSAPKLVELEIKRDGTLVSDYHFDDEYVETAVFSQTFPQLTYFSGSGGFQRGCINREPECEQLRGEVKSYLLNTLHYLDIDHKEDPAPKPEVATRRREILACADHLRGKIITSTQLH